ncbi:hypothetical protein C8F04DRAFT_1196547 [Mycena alexandri]|uniref:Uncharacterized protein n=1 Tax=Mycena alexandri TaxID=1745969 RepID=A0AAD6S4U4_9AGAR|nr:hypothetical protein C8F04DRAFT_1196547 [Mycena alexandri]
MRWESSARTYGLDVLDGDEALVDLVRREADVARVGGAAGELVKIKREKPGPERSYLLGVNVRIIRGERALEKAEVFALKGRLDAHLLGEIMVGNQAGLGARGGVRKPVSGGGLVAFGDCAGGCEGGGGCSLSAVAGHGGALWGAKVFRIEFGEILSKDKVGWDRFFDGADVAANRVINETAASESLSANEVSERLEANPGPKATHGVEAALDLVEGVGVVLAPSVLKDVHAGEVHGRPNLNRGAEPVTLPLALDAAGCVAVNYVDSVLHGSREVGCMEASNCAGPVLVEDGGAAGMVARENHVHFAAENEGRVAFEGGMWCRFGTVADVAMRKFWTGHAAAEKPRERGGRRVRSPLAADGWRCNAKSLDGTRAGGCNANSARRPLSRYKIQPLFGFFSPNATRQTMSNSSPTASQRTSPYSSQTQSTPSAKKYSSSQTQPVSQVGPQNTQATTDQPNPDNALPVRRTCPMPFYPEPEVTDVDEHSGNAKALFYVCIPARVQGVYTDDKRARALVSGWRNGRAQSCQTYEAAQLEWAMCCRRWHGPVCKDAPAGRTRPPVTMETRIRLNPDLLPLKWALRGSSDVYISRQAAFAAAEALNLKAIHILGSSNASDLEEWQYADAE